MAMPTTRSRDDYRNDRNEMEGALEEQRRQKHMMARQLAEAAIGEWRRTIEGIVAAPAAVALGAAAATMMGVELVVAGFETFQRSMGMLQEDMDRSMREQRRFGEEGRRGEMRRELRGDESVGGPPGPMDREPPRA
jgi:hypothetical protein